MSQLASVIPLAEHEDLVVQIAERLKNDPSDVDAANFVLSLVEQHVVSPELAHELYKEAILRVYLIGDRNDIVECNTVSRGASQFTASRDE